MIHSTIILAPPSFPPQDFAFLAKFLYGFVFFPAQTSVHISSNMKLLAYNLLSPIPYFVSFSKVEIFSQPSVFTGRPTVSAYASLRPEVTGR
jgi:hypothetical protein